MRVAGGWWSGVPVGGLRTGSGDLVVDRNLGRGHDSWLLTILE